MRPIPETITDSKTREQLTEVDQQIDEKMKRVNELRAAMKKRDLTSAELQELKQVSTAIDQLDKQWKQLLT